MTLEFVKDYLNVYDDEQDTYIEMLMNNAQSYIDNMCGEGYKNHEKAINSANQLMLFLIDDWFNNKGTTLTIQENRNRVVDSILDLLGLYSDEEYEGDTDESN